MPTDIRERYIVPGGSMHPADACQVALTAVRRWLDTRQGSPTPLAVFNAMGSAHNNPWMAEAAREYRVVSWRTRYQVMPDRAAVLLFFPDAEVLGWYEEAPSVPALFVVESPTRTLDAWRMAYGPTDLTTGGRLDDAPAIVPLVAVALGELNSWVNTNHLVNQEDVAAAVRTLEVLRDGGYPVNPASAEAWALTEDWSPFAAARLRELAEKVRTGHRFRLKDSSGPRRSDLERWRETADKNPTDPLGGSVP
jgi:hypothetical protein